jgi:rhodanese-related sulfurtransferase
MYRIKIILSLLILTLSDYAVTAQNTAQKEEVIQINSLEFQALIEKGNGTLLDVRTKSEFDAEHIENSGQLNYYSSGFKRKLELLPDDQPILLYCNTGYRSRKAAEYLVKKGYTQVYNLEHGIMEWNVEDLPVVEGDKSQLNKENMVKIDEYKQLISSESLVFIDFYAQWCAPCRKMMPMIDSLKTEYYDRIIIEKVNADVSKKLIRELELIGVPYFVLYRNDQLLYEKNGLVSREELIAVFDKYLQD